MMLHSVYLLNLKFQAFSHFVCGCTAWFVSDLVGNPKDRFFHNAAHISYTQDWLKDEAPEQDREGFYNTSMPVIILFISHILYSQDWLKDEAPEQDGEGFYNTSMPVIIFKMIEQNVSTCTVKFLNFRTPNFFCNST